MDSFEILNFVRKCCHLKHKFLGVFAADNFPGLKPESFIIVNASESSEPGTHWLLLCRRQNNVYFADPLGYSLENYQEVFKRLCQMYLQIIEVLKSQPIQPMDSVLCGLYCIYIAHILFDSKFSSLIFMNDNDSMRFSKHML